MGRKKKKPVELPPPEDDDEDWAAEAAALLAEAEIGDNDAEAGGKESKADMLRRHKDELKALKEEARLTIPKGADKEAKQQAEAEYRCSRAALEEQHAAQLAVFDAKPDAAMVEEVMAPASEGKPTAAVSKAQRKREKKQAAAAALEAEMEAESEAAGREGVAAMERAALQGKLAPLNRRIKEVPANGHCLYLAVAHQLESSGRMEDLITAAEKVPANAEDRSEPFWLVRRVAAAHLRSHEADFLPFVPSEDGMGVADSARFAAYCDEVASSAAWGGQLELQALATVLKVPITVYQAGESNFVATVDAATGPPLELTYHRHQYSLGEHYNSVEPTSE